eukprot:gene16563-22793_t
MATAGVVFLESSLDEKTKGTSSDKYKPGNTDVIRTMLREQQRDCKLLHANALFREFRDGGQKLKKFGKGYVVSHETATAPSVDDFQAEGQTRLFDLIKHVAVKDGKPLRGVWASFGKPYQCLGDPTEPAGQLPKLYRDELAANEGIGRGRGKKGKAVALQTSNAPATASGSPASAPRRKAPVPKADGGLDEAYLIRNKTVMKFSTADELDCKFPEGPLKQAADRRGQSKIRHGAFLNGEAAEAEIVDPALAYGQPPAHMKKLSPVRRSRDDDVGNGQGADERSVVFITQGMGGETEEPLRTQSSTENLRRQSYNFSERGASVYGGRVSNSGSGGINAEAEETEEATRGSSVMPGGPGFHPLADKAMPSKGDESNPVYGWHNKFMDIREKGRNSLQAALYQRAEGRFKARTNAPMAANMSSLLMADLDLVQGKFKPYATGKLPANPFTKMEVTWAAQENRRARTAKATALDPEELKALQRFYDQLCALVEAQRMSDPLSLMIIHKVKSLLEGGTFLTRGMMTAVLVHIENFTRGCGLVRHNKYLLSLLTFISKCCNLEDSEFESLVVQYNLSPVVYGTNLPASLSQPATPLRQPSRKTRGLVNSPSRLPSAKERSSPSRGREVKIDLGSGGGVDAQSDTPSKEQGDSGDRSSPTPSGDIDGSREGGETSS